MSVAEEFSHRSERLVKELLRQPGVLFNAHRIGILLELYHAGAMDFPQLRDDLGTTDGGLATHLNLLAREGLVEAKQEQVGSRTRTVHLITKQGIVALEGLLRNLSEIRKALLS